MTTNPKMFAYDVPLGARHPGSRAAPSTRVASNRVALAKVLKTQFGSLAAASRALGFDEMPTNGIGRIDERSKPALKMEEDEADGPAARRAIEILRDSSADSPAQKALKAIEALFGALDDDCRAALRELLAAEPAAVDYQTPALNGIERARLRRDANDRVARAIDSARRPPAAPRGVPNPETFFAPFEDRFPGVAGTSRGADVQADGGSFEQHFRNRGRAA